VVENIEGLNNFYRQLIRSVPLSDVTSCFAMEQIKHTTTLPIAMEE